MTIVKNLAGLAILLGVFGLGFLIGVGLLIFALTSIFGGSFGLIALAALAIAGIGIYMSGGVLYLFARNFSWQELMVPDVAVQKDQAPVAIEVQYDDIKRRRFLVDSRHSPRSANPKKLGRGVFIMTKKRGVLLDDSDVVTLIDSSGTKITNVRDFDNKIHFDFKATNKSHTMTITALIEHSSNFGRKDSWDPLESKLDSKEKIAEAWADSLKKA